MRFLFPFVVWLFAFTFCPPTTSALAQSRAPFAIVCSAGISRTLDDVNYVGRIAQRPGIVQRVNGLLAGQGGLNGIDRDRPWGLMFFLTGPEKPAAQALLAVPVADVEALQATLAAGGVLALAPGDKPDWYTLTTPKKVLSVRMLHDYAFVSESQDLLQGELYNLLPALAALAGQYDLSVAVERAGFPQELMARFQVDFDKKMAGDLAPRETETAEEHQVRVQATQLLAEAVHIVADGLERAELGLDVSELRSGSQLTLRLLSREGSLLAQSLPAWGRPASNYSHVARHAALRVELNVSLPEGIRAVLAQLVGLGAQKFELQFAQGLPPEVRSLVMGAFQTLSATAQSGDVELLAAFIPDAASHMSLLLSAGLKETQGLGAAARTVLPYAEQGGDVRNVAIDLENVVGTSVHRFEGKATREQDRKLYGGDPAVYLGIGKQQAWLAVGTQSALPILREAIASATPVEQVPPLATAELHLQPWLPLIAANHRDKTLIMALQNVFGEKGRDRLYGELTADPAGLTLRLAIDEGYLHLLGTAIAERAGRQ